VELSYSKALHRSWLAQMGGTGRGEKRVKAVRTKGARDGFS